MPIDSIQMTCHYDRSATDMPALFFQEHQLSRARIKSKPPSCRYVSQCSPFMAIIMFALLIVPSYTWSLLLQSKLLSFKTTAASSNSRFRFRCTLVPFRRSLTWKSPITSTTSTSTRFRQCQDNDGEGNNSDSFYSDNDNESAKDLASYNNKNNDDDEYIDFSKDASDATTETINPSTSTSTNQDMTDRFKYKVNALMGAFDPIDSSTDTETSSGNILTALLKFPVMYTFHVVGKTAGDASIESLFVEQVKETIRQSSSTPPLRTTTGMTDGDDENDLDGDGIFGGVKYEIIPRGSKFTKVSIQKEVINAEEITHIYDQLSKLERSVMQF